MQVRLTYKYRMFNNKKNKHIDDAITVACNIWNHCIALQRRYYKMYGQHISGKRMKAHIAKLRKNNPKYAAWKTLNSQTVQDIIERIERSYDAFFTHIKEHRSGRKSPPKFKKPHKYSSITFKQTGFKYGGDNQITIMGISYKFVYHRPMNGTIKTITIKRTNTGKYFICFSVVMQMEPKHARTSQVVGIDFGLKHFLTLDNGEKIESPLWYKQMLSELKIAHRNLSRCKRGSHNYGRRKRELALLYEKIDNKRLDFFFKQCYELYEKYDKICIEDLNIEAMKRLWGRKISDLAFSKFVEILDVEAALSQKDVVKVDRFFPSSKMCSNCGSINEDLQLKNRTWTCPHCGKIHDRDVNAAINIRNEGLRISA